MRIPSEILIEEGVEAAYQAFSSVQIMLRKEREETLSELQTEKIDNITREIDRIAESTAKSTLYKLMEKRATYRDALVVWGEESILKDPNLDFSREERTVALLDMIDGTDLVNHELGNWCSAMVFFYPPAKEILAAIVGLPDGDIYCAQPGKLPFVLPRRIKAHLHRAGVVGRSIQVQQRNTKLENAAICFFGQKASNLLSIMGSLIPKDSDLGQHTGGEFLLAIHENKKKSPFRIYTLGGNPMMLKVVDGTMDAVFELLGQHAHDVVPGAYIAKMAGAVVRDLNGNDLRLEEVLMRPNNRETKYIIAASDSLYEEIRSRIVGPKSL